MRDRSRRRRAFWALAVFVFLWMLLLNALTPYIADDFTFCFAFDTLQRLHTLPELFHSLVHHYFHWTGRVIVKIFAQGFTMLPKAVFNVCNAAAYLGLGLVLYRLARGRRSGTWDLTAFALIELGLWLLNPAFGQTSLWMCGSCNYLWATLGCCAYLLPWRYWLQKPFAAAGWMAPAMAVGGLLAGWLSENTSAGLLVCLVLCLAAVLAEHKKAPVWMWAGLGGALAGFVLLIAAPGNYERAAFFTDELPFLTRYAVRFFTCLNILKDHALPELLAFAVLFVLLWQQQRAKRDLRPLLWPLILFAGALGANFAMVLSPFYYLRSGHGVFSLLIAACAACLTRLEGERLRRLFAAGTAAAAVLCAFTLCEAGYDIASYWMMDRTRDTWIRAQAAAQSEPYTADIVAYGIEPYTRWCGASGLPDIRLEGGDDIALRRADWYGVRRLTANESYTYPFPGHTNAAYEAGLQQDAKTTP